MMEHYTYRQMEVSVFQQAKPGKTCCGDGYFVMETEHYFLCLLVDGLGSGEQAKWAADRAIAAIKQAPGEDLHTLMAACNQALRVGRGAVLSMFKIFFDSGQIAFSGIGNICFMYQSPDGKVHYPLPTVGFMSGRPQSYRVQTFPYEAGSSFIIYSDGLELTAENYMTLLGSSSLSKASMHMERLGEKKGHQNDDVTLLFGKWI